MYCGHFFVTLKSVMRANSLKKRTILDVFFILAIFPHTSYIANVRTGRTFEHLIQKSTNPHVFLHIWPNQHQRKGKLTKGKDRNNQNTALKIEPVTEISIHFSTLKIEQFRWNRIYYARLCFCICFDSVANFLLMKNFSKHYTNYRSTHM